MPNNNANLAALVGSRLCHDLISPVGAIQNGLELLGMSGISEDLPEMELIRDSCASAAARIRFFRVAFGSAGDSQMMGRREIHSVLEDLGKGGRVQTEWRPETDLLRTDVQLAFLAYLCFETALPMGGTVRFDRSDAGWSIAATGPRIKVTPGLWAQLEGEAAAEDVTASKVQFTLLALLADERGKTLRVHSGETALRMEIL